MATPKWNPGQLYPPGSLVVPRTVAPPINTEITNAGFESGDATGWTFGIGMSVSTARRYAGAYSLRCTGTAGTVFAVHESVPCSPGQAITASCMYHQGAADSDRNVGCVALIWIDANDDPIGAPSLGNIVRSSSGGFRPSTVSATAPAGTVRVSIAGRAVRDRSDASDFDQFAWNYAVAAPPAGLVFRATQAETGYSGTTEPVWPTSPGVPVTDNQVTWEGALASRVTWQASPILKSDATEPNWPERPGTFVSDGTISWEVVTRMIEDPKCPESKIVTILASKVFAADGDIVRFSATTNPKDWSSASDAGYLPTGLHQYGSNPAAAMGPYRSNLIPFNAEGFQMWTVDENPENMALQDAMPIGSTRHHALCPVGDDLLFLSSQGVRSIGIAAGSTNLQGGDVGMPIDPLVTAAVTAADAGGHEILSLYYLTEGQYWLLVNHDDGCQVFVHTSNRAGEVGAWSRYLFPFQVDDWAIKGDVLYLSSGENIYRLDESAIGGDVLEPGGDPVPFEGVLWLPWLDLGSPGITKRLFGFDIVGEGQPTIEFGYNQAIPSAFTAPLQIPADSVPGQMLPMQLSAPSMSVRIKYDGTTPWHFQALNLVLDDDRIGT